MAASRMVVGARLPAAARRKLEEYLALCYVGSGFRVHSSRIGYTHRGKRVRLVHLKRVKGSELLPNQERHLFTALEPDSGKVLCSRALIVSRSAPTSFLAHGGPGTDFRVPEAERRNGLAALVTAEASGEAVKQGKGIYVGPFARFPTQKWPEFFFRIGFLVGPGTDNEGRPCVKGAVHPEALEAFASREGREGYRYYLLRKRPPKEENH